MEQRYEGMPRHFDLSNLADQKRARILRDAIKAKNAD